MSQVSVFFFSFVYSVNTVQSMYISRFKAYVKPTMKLKAMFPEATRYFHGFAIFNAMVKENLV